MTDNIRLTRLRTVMATNDLEALLVTHIVNCRYLTGFTGSAAQLLITKQHAILLTDFRYVMQATQQAPHFEVRGHASNIMDTLKELIADCHIAQLGFEQDHLSFSTYHLYEAQLSEVRWIPVRQFVEQLRMIKDETELNIMREAAALSDRAFMHTISYLKPGMAERDVALELEWFMRNNGATGCAFEMIVASGERSALPHGIASERLIQANEWITLDFGAKYKGYCSDMTRMVMMGKPTAKQQDMYNIVLEAQCYTLAHLRPGMTGCEADALARNIITRYGYGAQFGHSTGHGLGLEVHEYPSLSSQSDIVLRAGMVVTVEPGIYLPHWGGVRIEDDVIITDDGIEVITKTTKQLFILGGSSYSLK